MKRNVILVTDGDRMAKRAVERAAGNIGARCISTSAGNPTRLSGEQIVNMIMSAPHDPVVVMLDDRGEQGTGKGERALEYIASHPYINVLGALAVASNTQYTAGTSVDESVTREGRIVSGPVDKLGYQRPGTDHYLEGDTVEILDRLNIPVVVGIGDIGKMDGADDPDRGSPLTTKALQEIMDRSGFVENSR